MPWLKDFSAFSVVAVGCYKTLVRIHKTTRCHKDYLNIDYHLKCITFTVTQKERIFKNNCNFSIFNIKIALTPKQPVINEVLITYIDYSITENYIGKMASFLPYTRPEPLLKVLHHIY